MMLCKELSIKAAVSLLHTFFVIDTSSGRRLEQE